jgi:dipeptidyl aminopeptidase/acylaminoacyl peptidase
MAAAAILTYPDFYKAAVAASGNHDNSIYNKAFAELYHGAGKIPTTMELAKNLKGHLMLVTGDADNNVHPAHTLRLARALIDAEKDFDFVVLPGEAHNYSGKNRDFFERKMWQHFARHLFTSTK